MLGRYLGRDRMTPPQSPGEGHQEEEEEEEEEGVEQGEHINSDGTISIVN